MFYFRYASHCTAHNRREEFRGRVNKEKINKISLEMACFSGAVKMF